MSLRYNVKFHPDSSCSFSTDNGDTYLIYFLEYPLPDAHGNTHTVYTFGFLCNESFEAHKFSRKHDPKIKATIIKLVSDFIEKRQHSALIYFCYGEDGRARHRDITFRAWSKDLPHNIEIHHKSIYYNSDILYTSLIVVTDNPLKFLIVDAFDDNLNQLLHTASDE